MYKVCFVDDEVHTHHVWERLINWQEKGFVVAGTATDGREALELFQKECPDLMLIDIKMPIMDGLECIRRIRAISSSVKLVLVTAFSEFEFAQQAIASKVSGYLLKPVKRASLFELVERIVLELNADREHSESFKAAREKQYKAELELSLQSMISERPSAQNFGVLYQQPLVLADLRFCEKDSVLRDSPPPDEVLRILEDWLAANHFISAAHLQISYRRMLLLLPLRQDLTKKFPYIVQHFEKHGILCDACLLEEPLRRDNLDIVRFRLEETEDRGFYQNSGSFGFLLENIDFSAEKIFLMSDSHIFIALEKLSPEPVVDYVADELKNASMNRIKPRIVKESCFELLEQMKMNIRIVCGFDVSDVFSAVSLPVILGITRFGRLREFMEREIRDCFFCLLNGGPSHDRGKALILKANAYTSLHFTSRNFCVRQVAEYIGLSRNYFTKIYKEISGLGFWEFVTRLRMKKAMQLLLNTDDTISAIAEAVGYNSEYHFSRKFKDYAALSPGSYRKHPPGA
jgi:AraC-like DNA-binding protein/DNA-binding NarL/FixJ family response regulator